MSLDIHFANDAAYQILEACVYYDGVRPGLGDELDGEIKRLLELLRDHPAMYPVFFDSTRRALVTRFHGHLFYQIIGNQVVVTEYRDARREPPRRPG